MVFIQNLAHSPSALLKGYIFKISINRSVLKEEKSVTKRHQKKLETLSKKEIKIEKYQKSKQHHN